MFSRRQQVPLNVSFNVLRCNFAQEKLTSTSSRHAILVFIVPILVNFIDVKFQGKFISPFDTHPLSTMVAILSLLAYCLAYGVEQTFSSSTSAHIFRGLMTFSGSLSLASLASILLPDCFRLILYTFYISVSIGEFRPMFQRLYDWIRQIIMEKIGNVFVFNVQELQVHARRTRPLLPRSLTDVRYLYYIIQPHN